MKPVIRCLWALALLTIALGVYLTGSGLYWLYQLFTA